VITHLDENKAKCEAMKENIKGTYGPYEKNEVWMSSQIFLQHNYVITENICPRRSEDIDFSALQILRCAAVKANAFISKYEQSTCFVM